MTTKRLNCCRICGSGVEPFMTFGRMPLANGFLTREQVADEYYFDLDPAICSYCNMFQIIEQPPRDKMFHENYAFLSSTSRYMQCHFEQFAEFVMNKVLAGRSDPF